MRNEHYIKDGVCHVTLTRGKVCTIDLDDMDTVGKHRWYAMGSGDYLYAAMNGPKGHGIKPSTILLHRFITKCPYGMVVDHIDHNTMNYNKNNLRICTQAENLLNRKPDKGSTSRYLGVCWDKSRNKWTSTLSIKGVTTLIGRYSSETEARDERAKAFIAEYGTDANPDQTKLYLDIVERAKAFVAVHGMAADPQKTRIFLDDVERKEAAKNG